MMNIPVAVFGFNRPETLAKAIEGLRALKPVEVWLFIDGPRPDHPLDEQSCAESAAIAARCDWGCRLVLRRNVMHKGPSRQVCDGLSEFFATHAAGLVMEDDALLSPSAAAFIDQIIDKIDGVQVAAASLHNFLFAGRSSLGQAVRTVNRPYLSRLFHHGAWVTTRAGWALYRDDIQDACDDAFFRQVELQFSGFQHPTIRWKPKVASLRVPDLTWHDKLQLSLWKADAQCIVPPINLAIQIGLGEASGDARPAPSWINDWHLEDGAIDTTTLTENLDCDIEELSLTDGVPAWTRCRLCHAPAQKTFLGSLLGTPRLYYECQECASLQTSRPSWLKAAHADPMSAFDTGVVLRNLNNFVVARNVIDLLGGDAPVRLLDYGAGSGMLTRLLRDSGADAYAFDAHCQPQLAGAYAVKDLTEFAAKAQGSATLWLGMEVLEQFTDPDASLQQIFAQSPHALLVSAEVYSGQDADWTHLMPLSGQRVFFYSLTALSAIAEKYGYDLHSDGSTHLFLSHRHVAPEKRAMARAWRDALRNSIYGDGGVNRFITHLKGAPGIAADHQALVSAQYERPPYLQPRIFLNRPDHGKLYVDCVFYQMASTGIAKLWNEVFRIWADRYGDRVVLLDRGGDIADYGLPREKLQPFNFSDPSASLRSLTWDLMRRGAHAMLSTYYTYCEHLPTRAVVYDMIPETLGFSGPEWNLKTAYLQRAESSHSISGSTQKSLVQRYPHLDGRSRHHIPGISPAFRPLTPAERTAARSALGVERRLLFVLPCPLGGYKDGITALQAASLLPFANEVEIIATVPFPDPDQIARMFPQLRIRFQRIASDDDYARLVASADLILWPPRIEGLGLPPLEGIASGTPMVCCRTDVNLELYGDIATYAETGNPESFAAAITTVLGTGLDPRLSQMVAGLRDYESYAVDLFNFGLLGSAAPQPAQRTHSTAP